MHNLMTRSWPAWLVLGLVVSWLGCGSGGRIPVTGSVTFDGQPVDQGVISFEPADGHGPSAGGRIEAGTYSLDGDSALLAGEKIVRISAVRKTGRQIEAGPPEPPGTRVDEIEPYIPAKYNAQSVLTCEITSTGKNVHNFELTQK